MEGICRYLGLTNIPKSLNRWSSERRAELVPAIPSRDRGKLKVKGNDGNAKLNDLYSKARRIYQKGYQVKELVASLDMSVIRKKNADALADLEKALNVSIQ